jgi:uncharacterized phage protein gp47/JayE
MAFTRPTLSRLIARAKSDIQTRLTGAVAFLRRSVEFVLAVINAGMAHGLHGHLVYLSRQQIPDTAEDELMVRWASIFSITRNPAVAATGSVDITGSNGSTCPDGTEWQTTDESVYTQDGDATIAAGSATITVDANEAGADGNQDVGTALSLVSPVAGIDSAGTVSGSGLEDGLDAETDPRLLVRLLSRMANPPKGGGPVDYVNWALEVTGVTRAWQIPNGDGLGTVVLYFVMDDKTGTIIPDAGEIATVQDYLDDVAPVVGDVRVYAPTAVDLDFTIAVVPDTAAVRTAVETQLEDYIEANAVADGITFPLTQLDESISGAVGETDHTMTVPAAAPTYTVGQIAVMGTITWA